MKVQKKHIHSEWSEGHPESGGEGYWIALKTGWKWGGDPMGAVHSIHEDTKAKAHAEGVMPCNCRDCQCSSGT